jgi:tRNA (guanine37-N1)-methyltransferase
MVIADTVTRLIPNVIKPDSLKEESFSQMENENWKMINNTEYPQYTRPEDYNGWKVPKVLLSGNHTEIEKWRKNS